MVLQWNFFFYFIVTKSFTDLERHFHLHVKANFIISKYLEINFHKINTGDRWYFPTKHSFNLFEMRMKILRKMWVIDKVTILPFFTHSFCLPILQFIGKKTLQTISQFSLERRNTCSEESKEIYAWQRWKFLELSKGFVDRSDNIVLRHLTRLVAQQHRHHYLLLVVK